MARPRATAADRASARSTRRRPAPEAQSLARPEAALRGQSWIEMDAGLPLPGPLELAANVVLTPEDGSGPGDGAARVRGQGNPALRRRLVDAFLAMGFEVAQARHEQQGGLVAGPWVLELRPPLELAQATGTLTVRGDVRVLSRATGSFPVVVHGDLTLDPQVSPLTW